MSSYMFLPSWDSFPGLSICKNKDGEYLVDFGLLWHPFHASTRKSPRLSKRMEGMQTRLQVMHPLLYPEDDKNVMGFKPFQNSDLGADGTLGVGVHMHFMMTLFWWGFGAG